MGFHSFAKPEAMGGCGGFGAPQVLTFVRFAVMDLRKSIEAGQDQLKSHPPHGVAE